jgi:ABC-type uncharacterized transport system YnjBCD substrate-binding protein
MNPMNEKEKPVLSDPQTPPTDAFLENFLGHRISWWNSIMEDTMKGYPDVIPVWRFYNDGKQWLFRLMQKKNTIFWLSLVDNTFRITFYFPDRVEPLLEKCDVPESMKVDFMNSQHYGKIRGMTVRMDTEKDVDIVKKLIAVKLQLK